MNSGGLSPRPYFRRRLTDEQVSAALTLLQSYATVTQLTVEVRGVATHPEDDAILSTAVSAAADYLVTGDRKLQALGNYKAVTIVSPRTFLEVLESGPAEQI
jgi:predicted nucleic acid-binding protein